MAAISSTCQDYLTKKGITATIASDGVGTLNTNTLSAQQLEDLHRAAQAGGYVVSLVAGVVTLKPRSQ